MVAVGRGVPADAPQIVMKIVGIMVEHVPVIVTQIATKVAMATVLAKSPAAAAITAEQTDGSRAAAQPQLEAANPARSARPGNST